MNQFNGANHCDRLYSIMIGSKSIALSVFVKSMTFYFVVVSNVLIPICWIGYAYLHIFVEENVVILCAITDKLVCIFLLLELENKQ